MLWLVLDCNSQYPPPARIGIQVSHALNTSAFGVARLKARFGKSLRPYDLVWPHVSTHENEAIQPSYIV